MLAILEMFSANLDKYLISSTFSDVEFSSINIIPTQGFLLKASLIPKEYFVPFILFFSMYKSSSIKLRLFKYFLIALLLKNSFTLTDFILIFL